MHTPPARGARPALPRGSLVALLTPFTDDLRLDLPALRRLIDWHIGAGTAGIVIAGTTGECATLSHAEHRELLAAAVAHAAGRTHVMAGVGANSTAEAVALARFAEECGADSLLSVVPYYNKPTQRGLVAHFSAQADATALPLVLYNVPGRTVIDLQVATVAELARHPRIAGLKDVTGDMARAADVALAVPPGFALYSGDDFTSLPYLALGGQGVISVVANILPAEVAALCAHVDAGRLPEARALFARMLPLTRALFAESSPGPAKRAAQLRGLCGGGLRLPMCEVSPATATAVRAALEAWLVE